MQEDIIVRDEVSKASDKTNLVLVRIEECAITYVGSNARSTYHVNVRLKYNQPYQLYTDHAERRLLNSRWALATKVVASVFDAPGFPSLLPEIS